MDGLIEVIQAGLPDKYEDLTTKRRKSKVPGAGSPAKKKKRMMRLVSHSKGGESSKDVLKGAPGVA